MEFKKNLLVLAVLAGFGYGTSSAVDADDLAYDQLIINRGYRKIQREQAQVTTDEELIACEIEDNSCVPADGESLGDDRRCCSGYSNSRNICEGRQ